MDNDLDNWIKYMKYTNKRKRDKININFLIDELKLMAINNIDETIKNNNMKGRQLTQFLSGVEDTFKNGEIVCDDQDKEFELTIKAFIYVLLDVIKDLKLELYASGKNFKINKYISEFKKNLSCDKNLNKKLKTISLSFVNPDNLENGDKIELIEDDYDDDYDDYDDYEEDELEEEADNTINKQFLLELDNISNKTNKNAIMDYFNNLDDNIKENMIDRLNNINNSINTNKPLLFHILNLPLPNETKKILLSKLQILENGFGDNVKMRNWFDNFMKLPIGIYKNMFTPVKINKFLNKLQKRMDKAILGHEDAKKQIIQIMAQSIRNPKAKGNVLGIYGVPGNGKTTLIKDGIAKALNRPFVFISLGGAQDSSYLDGHGYTYEGSIYGRIAQGLIDSKCMNPIFYFDELDKVSETHKGNEIINLLIHLIDPVQNSHFRDKYFSEIDLDLSQATFIFSFNDIDRVNYILLDRITCIETKPLLLYQKLHIAQSYMLPIIYKDIGLTNNDIIIEDDIIYDIINNYTNEGGVRKLKTILYEICREINLRNLRGDNIEFPYNLSFSLYQSFLENKRKYEPDLIHQENKIGMVNGLWANIYGNGGVLPIESAIIPGTKCMEIKATGSLQNVIKESIEVALTVAWNYISQEKQQEWLTRWKNFPECFHIHCPDGSVPKDGPSAGAAMGLTFYSTLTNRKVKHYVAMTGELNLRGEITRIGGLEEKLIGAKRAGAKLVLVPEENNFDIEQINKRNPDLINENFQIKTVKYFEQVLEYSLL
jgi:ATP-dependent Lon protease